MILGVKKINRRIGVLVEYFKERVIFELYLKLPKLGISLLGRGIFIFIYCSAFLYSVMYCNKEINICWIKFLLVSVCATTQLPLRRTFERFVLYSAYCCFTAFDNIC
jgi:hypothetical protein